MSDKVYTIAFMPLNASGHINGASGLLKKLSQFINIRVVAITIGPIRSSRLNSSNNCSFITIDTNLNEDKYIIDDPETQWRQEELIDRIKDWVSKQETIHGHEKCANILKIFHNSAHRDYVRFNGEYERILAEVKPDLIMIDNIWCAPGIANSGIPWISFTSLNSLGLYGPKLKNGAFPLWLTGCKLYSKQERVEMRENNPEKWQTLVDGWIEMRRKFNELFPKDESQYNKFAKEHGAIELETNFLNIDSPYMNVYMCPAELDYDQDDDILQMVHKRERCGSTLNESDFVAEQSVADMWDAKIEALRSQGDNRNKPLVYFSLGSLASGKVELMRRYIEIFSSDDKRLYVVSKGSSGSELKLNDSNMIGENFVPQSYLLSKVDLAIIHGGNNSTAECMFAGLPCIILPVFADQLDNAQRFEDLKLGKSFNVFRVEKSQLIDCIDDILLSQSIKLRMKQIGENIRQRDECGKVAKLIADKLINGTFTKAGQ